MLTEPHPKLFGNILHQIGIVSNTKSTYSIRILMVEAGRGIANKKDLNSLNNPFPTVFDIPICKRV